MKLHLKWKAMMLFLAIAAAGILAACSAGGQEPPPSQEPAPAPVPGQEQEIDPDKEVLVYAQLLGSNAVDAPRRDLIDRFNRSHDDVQIVVKDYSYSETDDQGPDRLLVEMAAGQVPDIIDLGGPLPFHQMVKKGYLEDLWPYIENDPELGREGVLEAPLKLSEVDGGLYMLFGAVEIETLVSSPELVGDRTSWTLRDLQDAFAAMPEGSTVLAFNDSRDWVATSLMRYSVGAYVDREAGTCSFDSPSFRSMMEFVQMFPSSEEVEEETAGLDVTDIWREARARQQKGLQLLEEVSLTVDDLPALDAQWGGRCALIGYPMEDGSGGSIFRPRGPQLGISSSCGNKEAAWEFVRTVMTDPPGQQSCIPLERDSYEVKKNTAMTVKTILDINYVTNEELTAPPLTEERVREFEEFFNSVDKIDIWDGSLFFLIREICDPYFAGARDLDETIRLLQNRVGLYLNEQM
ncbi:MAG: extracellular solute-binding protein [Oscillospiraceae bacterium]|nr:extracellular solute-binding protein [Oscillospiraceae bacterium]MDE7042863.1 extracellular solute-binding protein [Oscillospiraceae bacterium]